MAIKLSDKAKKELATGWMAAKSKWMKRLVDTIAIAKGYELVITANKIKRHPGRFSISQDMIFADGKYEQTALRLLMSKIVVVHAESNFIRRQIDYEAYSDELFEPVDDGHIIPDYEIIFDTEWDDNAGTSVTTVRCERKA